MKPVIGVPGVVRVFVLAVGTIAATIWAVAAAGWLDTTTATMVVGLTAVTAAGFLVRARVGSPMAGLFAPILGLAVIVPLTIPSMPADGTDGFPHIAVRYADALAGGLLSTTDWRFLVGLGAAMWAAGFWLGWQALARHRGVVAVLPCFMVLGPNAVNAPDPGQVALPESVAVGLALLLIAQCHLLDLSVGWRLRRVAALPGLERRYMRLAGIAAALIVLAGAVAPAVSSHDYTTSLLAKLGYGGGTGATGRGVPRPATTAPASTAPASTSTVAYSANTIPGGPLRLAPVPVLTYTADGGAPLYLRVGTDTVFRDGGWYPPDAGRPVAPGYTESAVSAAAGVPIPRDRTAAGDVGSMAHPVMLTVHLSQFGGTGDQPLAMFPGEPDEISTAATANGLAADGRGFGPARLLTIDTAVIAPQGAQLTTSGLASTATADELRAAEANYPQWARDVFLDTGPNSAALVPIRTIADRWTAAAASSSPYDRAVAIETHLRTDFQYSLSPPAAPAGVWPIVDFLTRTHQGYCQYFAAAMGVMLRLEGIPARLVTGYGPGSPSGSARGVVRHQVTTSDAHVWVQGYVPRYGWIDFEPTPPSSLGNYQVPGRGVAPPSQPVSTPMARPSPRVPSGVAPLPSPPAAGMASGHLAHALVTLLIVAVLWIGALTAAGAAGLFWLARPRSLGSAWRRLRLMAWLFGPPRRASESYAAYARRLGHSLPVDTITLTRRDGAAPSGPGPGPRSRPVRSQARAALLLLATTSECDAFAAIPLDSEKIAGWRDAWKRLVTAWPLLVWRRLISRPWPGRPTSWSAHPPGAGTSTDR